MKNRIFECILIGEQSLLIRCAEILLSQGQKIKLVISANSMTREWCVKNNIHYSPSGTEYRTQIDQIDFDYLFSITNLKMLTAGIINKPRLAAINFHDGPLPHYAGLNTPVWALLDEATEYGITWHLMTSVVDQGDILKQQLFSVESTDTAFSLNTKCYEAGAETFGKLVRELALNKAKLLKQTRQQSYFPRDQRPQSACFINWQHPAHKIDALLRALDAGPYFNPMGLAKIYLGKRSILVRSASIVDRDKISTLAVAGTILGFDEKSLTVSCKGSSVCFSNLETLEGKPCNIVQILELYLLNTGSQLPSLPEKQSKTISALNRQACIYEEFWIERLAQSNPVEVPPLTSASGSHTESSLYQGVTLDLAIAIGKLPASQANPVDIALSVIALLLGRLNNGVDCFDIAYSNDAWRGKTSNAAAIFSDCMPFNFKLDYRASFSDLLENVIQQRELINKTPGFLLDLYARSPELSGLPRCGQYPVACYISEKPGTFEFPDDDNHAFVFAIHPRQLTLYYRQESGQEYMARKLLESFSELLESIASTPDARLYQHNIVSEADRKLLFHAGVIQPAQDNSLVCIHQLFEQQVEKIPHQIAVDFEGRALSYVELNSQANQLAHLLLAEGAKPENRVGVLVDRSLDMMVSLFAVLKAGCAYIPLDPLYPAERLVYMVNDAAASLVITQQQHLGLLLEFKGERLILGEIKPRLRECEHANPALKMDSHALAYVIYTSGSTGKPKGVMVEHRNVSNFFLGMDVHIGIDPGVWLAVTSISFDISVLELFWTLCRGFKVILFADEVRQKIIKPTAHQQKSAMDFSLFYWNVATEESEYDEEKYRLLLESAQYADRNGFSAVWTPERHFSAFGGLYPNPSITSAALSTITSQIQLRAGSCVVPLHSPIRIAEEWAVVDNLSHGRVGLSIAAGWAPPDFAINPENFADAKNIMFESLDTIKRLWRGETVAMPGPKKPVAVRTLPRPIQKELPIWVTTAGNIDTYLKAAEIGANILTHLLGQTLEEVAEKISVYRMAWKKHGHAGEGKVSLMLHTFVGSSEASVKAHVRLPMKNYLKSAMFLVKDAAWNFPTFKKFSEAQGKTLDDYFETISDQDMDALLEFALQRYYGSSGLFGTPESCLEMVAKVKAAGVNEIGCLIDFGIATDTVLEHLPYLNTLRELTNHQADLTDNGATDNIPALIKKHQVSHFQCTPSMATLLSVDQDSKQSLTKLKHLLIGGETFPPELANELNQTGQVRISNLYGPTETTIWSSTFDVDQHCERTVPVGTAIANTQIYVLDKHQQPLPIGVPGEMVIGGDGVTRGYFGRQVLTDKCFIPAIHPAKPDDRMYLTGDLARFSRDGKLECLGRMDHQIKIRGYRIEPGEIETVLRNHDSVMECAVILREDQPGDQRLTAYLCPSAGHTVVSTILRRHVRQFLPEFMVPAAYIILNELPRTLNGKIDRKSLPSQTDQNRYEHKVVEPESDAEKYLASLWQLALDSEQVSTRDNFFEAGGHSLLAAQVVAQIKQETGIATPLATMVVNTLGQIATEHFPANWNPKEPPRKPDADAVKPRKNSRVRNLLGLLK